mmetsp:Transcript_1715/g.5060  ORF Transcript_1715/g.5060 Transcript_1715/m.5060 type:complete len:83 (-) Transcript_1715:796-1044(-)
MRRWLGIVESAVFVVFVCFPLVSWLLRAFLATKARDHRPGTLAQCRTVRARPLKKRTSRVCPRVCFTCIYWSLVNIDFIFLF